jgi:DNA-binding response OmpR family regulator
MLKIFIIDDEISLLEVIKDYLQKEGYEVFTSVNGEEALRLFAVLKPDFVILDLMLPEFQAKKLCRRIRKESMFLS